jgi:DNA polymerase-1
MESPSAATSKFAVQIEGKCPGGIYHYYRNPEEANPLLRSWEKAKWACFDFETGGVDPWASPLYLLSVSVKEGEAHVFDLRLLRQDLEFCEELRRFLSRVRLIAHNGSFEQSFCQAQLGVTANIQYDTMLVNQILTAGSRESSSLGDLLQRYFGVELDKTWQKYFPTLKPWEPICDEAITYSAGDVCQLMPLARRLNAELKDSGLYPIWEDIEKPFMSIVAEARHHGIAIDVDLLQQIRAELETAVDGHLHTWNEIVGWHSYTKGARKPVLITEPCVSISSWQQLTEYYAGHGIMLESTDEERLSELLSRKRLLPEVRTATEALLADRRDSKILGTYVQPMLERHIKGNTIHPNWKQCATATGRMACADPNAQNIPSQGPWAKIREAFIARPGHQLIIADYSQMELRVAAELSAEPLFVEAIKTGVDLHKQTASLIYQVPMEEVTKEQRSVAKTINFGICYGAGANTVAANTGLSVEDAQKLLDRFFTAYGVLREYLDRTGRHAQDHMWSATPAGRKRFYDRPDPTDKREYRRRMSGIAREGCNMPIQGCNADSTKLASIMAHGPLRDLGASILMWVHDEIVVEAPEEQAEMAADLLKECMIAAAETWVKSVPIDVSVTISERWEK